MATAYVIPELGYSMTRSVSAVGEKPLFWIRSSAKDLSRFPAEVQEHIGYALSAAQFGGKHPTAKPWKGDGPGVLEIVEDHRGDTYRAVYTVRFEEAVYVLHVFQKKSKQGIATTQMDAELIGRRLKDAVKDHEERYGKAKK
jgi:phage-related protein